MIGRPAGMGAFEFVVVAALRVAQLRRGCAARVDGHHSNAVQAQREVSAGWVARAEESASHRHDR